MIIEFCSWIVILLSYHKAIGIDGIDHGIGTWFPAVSSPPYYIEPLSGIEFWDQWCDIHDFATRPLDLAHLSPSDNDHHTSPAAEKQVEQPLSEPVNTPGHRLYPVTESPSLDLDPNFRYQSSSQDDDLSQSDGARKKFSFNSPQEKHHPTWLNSIPPQAMPQISQTSKESSFGTPPVTPGPIEAGSASDHPASDHPVMIPTNVFPGQASPVNSGCSTGVENFWDSCHWSHFHEYGKRPVDLTLPSPSDSIHLSSASAAAGNQPEPALSDPVNSSGPQLNPVTSPALELDPNLPYQSPSEDDDLSQSDGARKKLKLNPQEQHYLTWLNSIPPETMLKILSPVNPGLTSAGVETSWDSRSHFRWYGKPIDLTHPSPFSNVHPFSAAGNQPEPTLLVNTQKHQLGSLTESPALQLGGNIYNFPQPISHDNHPNRFLHSRLAPSDEIFAPNKILHYYSFDYKLVDFEPSGVDGKLVLKAVNNLKLDDGSRFFRIRHIYSKDKDLMKISQVESPQRMFCLKSAGSEEFFKFYSRLYTIKARESTPIGWAKQQKMHLRNNSIWQMVKDGHKRRRTSVSVYRDLVLSDFNERISILKKEHTEVFNIESDNDNQSLKKHQFESAVNLLPMYLLFVDLISAILPVEDLDATGELLRSQRLRAGGYFIQLLEDALLDITGQHTKHEDQIQNEIKRVLQNQSLGRRVTALPFVWKVLTSWLVKSREEILEDSNPTRGFRGFFFALASFAVSEAGQ